jgi:hypothetical protein
VAKKKKKVLSSDDPGYKFTEEDIKKIHSMGACVPKRILYRKGDPRNPLPRGKKRTISKGC